MSSEISSTKNKGFECYRVAFIRKGSSIPRWARDNGFSHSYIYDILHGHRKGEKAGRILQRIENYLNK